MKRILMALGLSVLVISPASSYAADRSEQLRNEAKTFTDNIESLSVRKARLESTRQELRSALSTARTMIVSGNNGELLLVPYSSDARSFSLDEIRRRAAAQRAGQAIDGVYFADAERKVEGLAAEKKLAIVKDIDAIFMKELATVDQEIALAKQGLSKTELALKQQEQAETQMRAQQEKIREQQEKLKREEEQKLRVIAEKQQKLEEMRRQEELAKKRRAELEAELANAMNAETVKPQVEAPKVQPSPVAPPAPKAVEVPKPLPIAAAPSSAEYPTKTAVNKYASNNKFEISEITYPPRVENNGGYAGILVKVTGSPEFPLTVEYRPRPGFSCRQGACKTTKMIFAEKTEVLNLKGAVGCDGYQQSSVLDYEVVVTDKKGAATPPMSAVYSCNVK